MKMLNLIEKSVEIGAGDDVDDVYVLVMESTQLNVLSSQQVNFVLAH